MINKINISFLTMFGIGYSRFAPGTIASFATCLFYIFCFNFNVNIKFLTFCIFVVLVYSILIIDKYSQYFESVDAKEIVIDEFIGQSIPALSIYSIISQYFFGQFIILILISFVLFRFFDVLKPFPINLIDKKIKNGFGVMLDDIVAGIFASIIVLITLFFVSDV